MRRRYGKRALCSQESLLIKKLEYSYWDVRFKYRLSWNVDREVHLSGDSYYSMMFIGKDSWCFSRLSSNYTCSYSWTQNPFIFRRVTL